MARGCGRSHWPLEIELVEVMGVKIAVIFDESSTLLNLAGESTKENEYIYIEFGYVRGWAG